MICRECEFNRFCYATDQERTECDEYAKGFKEEYYYHKREIELLELRKEKACELEAGQIDIAIDQLIDFMEYCCQDMSRPPRPETDELPF